MQYRCPLWSARCSVLIKTLISSVIWWFCTQSAGVLPPSASHLKVSSNLSSNTATSGPVFLVLRASPPGALGSSSMTGRKSICALVCIIYMYSLHSAIPVGVGELRINDFDHPPCCPKCVSHSEEWLVMSQEEGSSTMGRNMMVFIPVCLLLVKEDSSLQLLSGS